MHLTNLAEKRTMHGYHCAATSLLALVPISLIFYLYANLILLRLSPVEQRIKLKLLYYTVVPPCFPLLVQ